MTDPVDRGRNRSETWTSYNNASRRSALIGRILRSLLAFLSQKNCGGLVFSSLIPREHIVP